MQVLLSTVIAALAMYDDHLPEFLVANAHLNVTLEREGDLPLDLDVDYEDDTPPAVGESFDMTGTVGDDGVVIDDEKPTVTGEDITDVVEEVMKDAAEEGLEVPEPLLDPVPSADGEGEPDPVPLSDGAV